MPEGFHSYRLADGHGLRADPFNAIIGPRKIGWMSTTLLDGLPNLAPFSFFNAFNYRPLLIGFASSGWKDRVANIHASAEVVWNIATRPLADQVNFSSVQVGADVNEIALSGLHALPSTVAAPPRVANAPVAVECRLADITACVTRSAKTSTSAR